MVKPSAALLMMWLLAGAVSGEEDPAPEDAKEAPKTEEPKTKEPKAETPKAEAPKPKPQQPGWGWGGGGDWLNSVVKQVAPQVQTAVQKIQSNEQLKQVTSKINQAGKVVSSFVNSMDSSRLSQITEKHLVPKVVSGFTEKSTCLHALKVTSKFTIHKAGLFDRSTVDSTAYIEKNNVGDRQMDVVVKLYPKMLKIVNLFNWKTIGNVDLLEKNGKVVLKPVKTPTINLYFRMPSEDVVVNQLITQKQCVFTFQKVTTTMEGGFKQVEIDYNGIMGFTATEISDKLNEESVTGVIRQNVIEALNVLFENQVRKVDPLVCVDAQNRAPKPHDCALKDLTVS